MMYPDDEYIEQCFLCTDEEKSFYARITAHLPERNEDTPYHSGPHSVRQFKSALNLAQHWNGNVLETGFCLGHSASLLLNLGATSVVSIENSRRVQTLEASEAMKVAFGSKFTLIFGSAHEKVKLPEYWLRDHHFDLMFVDGGHDFEDVDADIRLGLSLGIETFLLDDYFPHWGPGVQPAMRNNKLIPVALLGTMMLAKIGHGFSK
jgi:predicted O-methyltransferase YrrM